MARFCTQAVLMTHFAGWREIGVKFAMRAASVDPKSTQLTPRTILVGSNQWAACENLEKNYARAHSTFPKPEHLHATWAAKPPTFGALFLSFGGVERARAEFFSRFSHAAH